MKASSAPSRKTNVASKPRDDEDVVAVAEIEDQDAPPSAQFSEEEKDELEMVKFALVQDVEPAPRVGKICLVRDYGMAVLKKGIVTIPRIVAEVLADKKYGEII